MYELHVDSNLEEEIFNFVEYVQKLKDGRPKVATVYIYQEKSNCKLSVHIINTEPTTCIGYLGKMRVNGFDIYIYQDERNALAYRDCASECDFGELKEEEFPVAVHHYERFYTLEEGRLKIVNMLE